MTSPQPEKRRARCFVWLMVGLGFFLALGLLLLVLGLAGTPEPNLFDRII